MHPEPYDEAYPKLWPIGTQSSFVQRSCVSFVFRLRFVSVMQPKQLRSQHSPLIHDLA
jgi:hypothetical protein